MGATGTPGETGNTAGNAAETFSQEQVDAIVKLFRNNS